jgi:hypothetical protein
MMYPPYPPLPPLPEPKTLLKYGRQALAVLQELREKARQKGQEHKKKLAQIL